MAAFVELAEAAPAVGRPVALELDVAVADDPDDEEEAAAEAAAGGETTNPLGADDWAAGASFEESVMGR